MNNEEIMKKYEEIYADFINENKYADYYRESMDSGMEIDRKDYEQKLRNMVHGVFNKCKSKMTKEQIELLTQAVMDDTKYRINLTDIDYTNIDYTIIDKNRKSINQGKVL